MFIMVNKKVETPTSSDSNGDEDAWKKCVLPPKVYDARIKLSKITSFISNNSSRRLALHKRLKS